jgi:hypothetical protein
MQAVMHGYVAWALEFPQRFKLVYGSWSKGSDELAAACSATSVPPPSAGSAERGPLTRVSRHRNRRTD